VAAFESSEFFFVSAGVGCDGFQGCAELVDLDLQAGEGECVPAALAVFFDDGSQFRASVEGGAADTDAGGYLGEVSAIMKFSRLEGFAIT